MTNTWTVEVWDRPPGEDRYVEPHPEHRARNLAAGRPETEPYCGTVDSVGRVFSRTYKTKAGAERRAERYRKIPNLYVDINPGFDLTW